MSPDRQQERFRGNGSWPERTRGARPMARLLPAGRGAEKCRCGNARIIAAPAYRRLLAAEPLLRRSIPVLIVIFLIVVAAVRFLSLMALRDDVERDAKAMLGACRRRARQRADACRGAGAATPRPRPSDLMQKTMQGGMLADGHVLAVTDGVVQGRRHDRPARPNGKGSRSTPSSPAASRSSCSATAPASWTSGSATAAGTRRSTSPTADRARRSP